MQCIEIYIYILHVTEYKLQGLIEEDFHSGNHHWVPGTTLSAPKFKASEIYLVT